MKIGIIHVFSIIFGSLLITPEFFLHIFVELPNIQFMLRLRHLRLERALRLVVHPIFNGCVSRLFLHPWWRVFLVNNSLISERRKQL